MQVDSLPQIINLETLLLPISDEQPAGASLQYSDVYDQIRQARRQDDQTLTQGAWQRELKTADWRRVVELATHALETETKDLQIAAWLIEALLKQHGFAGLRDGLKLVRGLHENFWATLFPEIDEGEMDARANALEFMDRQTAAAVKEIRLTQSGLNYLKWQESRRYEIPETVENLESDEREKFAALAAAAEAENRTTGAVWRAAKNATSRLFYEQTLLTLEESRSEFQALDRVMDDFFKQQTPGLNQLKKALDEVRDLIKRTTLEKRELEPDDGDDDSAADFNVNAQEINENHSSDSAPIAAAKQTSRAANGAISNRQDALKRLAEVAVFFRSTEPHSPVSYLVQRATRWGSMPLEELLAELIKDPTVMEQISETLGFDLNGKE